MVTESLLIKEGLAKRVGHRRENSQQIAALSDPVEHLPVKEGVRKCTAQAVPRIAGNRRLFAAR